MRSESIQPIETDEYDRPTLDRFRSAAAEVLTRRAGNADAPIERERWLAGWLRRLESYREPGHTLVAPK